MGLKTVLMITHPTNAVSFFADSWYRKRNLFTLLVTILPIKWGFVLITDITYTVS
jgi:hypothetical protein